MNKDKENASQESTAGNEQPQEQPVKLKNPFKPDEEPTVSQEEVDKEQEYKEALTEKD